MKKVLIGLIFIFCTTSANAGAPYAGLGTVKRYFPVANGTKFYFQLNVPHVNQAGCASDHYYVVSDSSPAYEEFKKVVLTAKASGHKIGLYVWEDAGRCIGSYPEVYGMFIE